MVQNLCRVPIMELSSGTIFQFHVNGLLKFRLSFKDVHVLAPGAFYREFPFSTKSKIAWTTAVRVCGCPLYVWVDRSEYPPARWFDAMHQYWCANDNNWYYRWQRFTRLSHFSCFGLRRSLVA